MSYNFDPLIALNSTTLFYSPIYLRPWMQKLQQNWNIIITTIIPYYDIWSLSFLVISSCFWFRCGGVSRSHHIVKLLRLTQRNFNLQNTKKSLGLRVCLNEKNRNLKCFNWILFVFIGNLPLPSAQADLCSHPSCQL